MIKEQCRIGMVVEFGRGNGEKTKGTIIAINPKKAKVKTLEARGRGNGSEAGSVWGVPYSMMSEVRTWNPDWGPVPTVPEEVMRHNPADDPMPYNQFSPYHDVCIMEAIDDIYNRLSPEWLTADGERPVHQIHALRGNLQNKLNHLFKALGRPVSESVVQKWLEEKNQKKVI